MNFIVKDGVIISDKVVTESHLKEQGYTTKSYVDARIEELDIVQRNEIETYIQNYISQALDTMIEEKIDTALTKKLQPIGRTEVEELIDLDGDLCVAESISCSSVCVHEDAERACDTDCI